jgi:outer membrane protein OmpU
MSADLYCASNSIVTYQRLSEKRGCGKAASFSGAIIGQCLEGLQSQPRKGETLCIPIPESPVRAKFFQPEGKLMKNVLFATTALVASAGIASAEFAMSASAKLSYGNYGTGIFNNAGVVGTAGDSSWGSEADVVVSMTGGGDTVSYSAALEIDEAGSPSAGPVSITTNGVTVKYDANDISDITNSGADGEDDNQGDIKISYAGGGLSASYAADLDDAAGETDLGYVVNLGYAEGDMSLGLETDGTTTEVAVGYTMGDIAFAANADNASTWDVSVAYTLGDSTITVATDEAAVATVALATSLNGLALSAKTGADNEFSVGYAADAFGFAIAYDSGNSAKFGDEAETTLVVDYAVDGMGFQLKANNQSEMEISSSLSF